VITFKEFLLEEDRTLSAEEALEFFKKHCSDWKTPTRPLWRAASKNEPIRVRDSSERVRPRSRSGNGAMHKWIFSFPAWNDFPERDRSIFCSTTMDTEVTEMTEDNTYAIFPVNGTKLAITKEVDFNFIRPFKAAEHRTNNLGTISYYIRTIAEDVLHIDGPQTLSADLKNLWEQILNSLEVDGKIDQTKPEFKRIGKISGAWLLDFHAEYPDIFQPDRMGVALETPSSFKFDGKQHEVWFSGKYLSVPAIQFSEFIKPLS
jgi:hypothetical protein